MKTKYIKCFKVSMLIFTFSLQACANWTKLDKVRKNQPIPMVFKSDSCLYGCPVGSSEDNFIVDHGIFILSSNRNTKLADWVAYVENKKNHYGEILKRKWTTDPQIPEQYTFIPEDYKDAYQVCNYSRGHQVPLASFRIDEGYKTNYLSNITPQKLDLNAGPWAVLEKKIRKLAKKTNVFVITGPYYKNKEICELPSKRIKSKIPNGYWKIIAIKKNEEIKLAAFSFPQQTKYQEDYCKYSSSLEEVQENSKLTFFPEKEKLTYSSLLKDLGCFEEKNLNYIKIF